VVIPDGLLRLGSRKGVRISQGRCHGMGEQGLGWVSKLRTVPDGSDPATPPAWSGVTSFTLAVVIPYGLLRLGSRKGERKVCFCQESNYIPLPLSEYQVCLFVAHLSRRHPAELFYQRLSVRSVKDADSVRFGGSFCSFMFGVGV